MTKVRTNLLTQRAVTDRTCRSNSKQILSRSLRSGVRNAAGCLVRTKTDIYDSSFTFNFEIAYRSHANRMSFE